MTEKKASTVKTSPGATYYIAVGIMVALLLGAIGLGVWAYTETRQAASPTMCC